jgi:hypothetical protein
MTEGWCMDDARLSGLVHAKIPNRVHTERLFGYPIKDTVCQVPMIQRQVKCPKYK